MVFINPNKSLASLFRLHSGCSLSSVATGLGWTQMERDEIAASCIGTKLEERGPGGKLRKPPPRKPLATPYARPAETTRRRWISKLVDPAYHLISGGATRIFPSFFSKTASIATLGNPSSATEDRVGKWQTDKQGQTNDGYKSDLKLGTPRSTEIVSTSDISDKLKSSSDFDLHKEDEKEEQSQNNRLSDIEEIVKGNKFSRDEFIRLVEVLNSKAIDLPNVEQGKEKASLTAGKDHQGLVVPHGLPKISNEQRHGELNGAMWGNSMPVGQSKIQDEIGATPIEIARAYMDSRAPETGPRSKSMIHNIESRVSCHDDTAIKPYDPSPSVKSSTCWPGAVVSDTYVTPQSQRSRYGLHNFPRTPYSRTLLSKSKSRLTHVQGNYKDISSTPLCQSQNTQYMQDKSRVDTLESGSGSVGPIRRIRHKFGSQSSRKPDYSSLKGLSQRESSKVNEGLMPAITRSSEPEGTNCTHKPLGFKVGVPTVHMHSSSMARKILEHIDRNLPTPKEKSAELNLAIKWKYPESSTDVSRVLSNEESDSLKLKDVRPNKSDGLDGKKAALRNEDQGNCHINILPRETDKSVDVREERTLTSGMNVSSTLRIGDETMTSQHSTGSRNLLMKSTEEVQDALKTIPCGDQPYLVNEEKRPLSNSSPSKPALTPISIKKPESKWTLASDNSSGFTFPVSASSSVFSDPPTPSIMPSFSTGDQNQSKESSAEPSYSFGLKRSSPAVVFSFPSTSNTVVYNDPGDIKFDFGYGKKTRLSFSSFGKNSVCC